MFTAEQAKKAQAYLYSFFNLGAGRGDWSTPRPSHFTPGEDPVPTLQEAGWAPGPVCTGSENVAATGIRSPGRPARSESLYRMDYPAYQKPRYRPKIRARRW